MRRTYAYIISIFILLGFNIEFMCAQDTLLIPLKIRVGAEISDPAIYFINNNILNTEANLSVDLNEKISAYAATGSLTYKYSQYNYEFLNHGGFFKAGFDFNLMKPQKSMGKYWVGIGLHYGYSAFKSEVPSFQTENYWGTSISSVAPRVSRAHFFEMSPGVRAEVFNNLSIGWTINIRKLISSSTGNDLKPIYFPGFGNGTKSISTGVNYFVVWNIPYRKLWVITKPPPQEDTEETTDQTQQAGGLKQ